MKVLFNLGYDGDKDDDRIVEQDMDPAEFGLFSSYETDVLIDMDDTVICFQGATITLETQEDGTIAAIGTVHAYDTHMKSRRARQAEKAKHEPSVFEKMQ
ncbi:hypothetical protein [uncultured Salinicola sp.]|uniref:hypothetical protein n=1 Tax=uncultured Salinicola sp. TaxID=1193542 RepID=UPI00260B4103|nr:hypothetical protein [uncultured Salinicola sp.]|tara:strand:- start:5854 stop:6153 length:300 start_codon:yes stop_codon:yes gene_type:complete